MNDLRILLFGRFRMRSDPNTFVHIESTKAKELFCYLLIYRNRPHPRETLANILWRDTQTTRSKQYLRKALWQLQDALTNQLKPPDIDLLLVEPDWIQLNPQITMWLDIAIFEQAFTKTKGVNGRNLNHHQVENLRNAIDLYQTDLLEGWYQDWCIYERERLKYMYLAILDKLMDYCETRHEYEAGIGYGTLALRYDQGRESTHRSLMRLHYLSGHRILALHQYERCKTILNNELGVQPSASTLVLNEQIRLDQFELTTTPSTKFDLEKQFTASHLHQVLECLTKFHVSLTKVQQQVQRDIHVVEQILN